MVILSASRIRTLWFLGVSLVLLSACTGFAPHRTDAKAVCHLTAEGKPTVPGCKRAGVETSPNFELAVVELTDQGWL